MVHSQTKWDGIAVTGPTEHHGGREHAATLREALDVYLSGRSGVRFQDLVRFAGPLFDLYDIEWRTTDAADSLERDREELSTMVAVLDTARLLWAFFSLDDERSVELLPNLEDALLGPGAGDEERSNLLILLSLLEEHWQTFTSMDRRRAEATPGYTLPDFETLLSDFSEGEDTSPSDERSRYGPERLELPEALALFAEPLLEDQAAKNDPDVLEERIARAQAYWDLAQAPRDQFEHELRRIQDEFSRSDFDAESVRREASRMVRRYRNLFPSGRNL